MFSLLETAHAADGISIKLSPYVVGYIGDFPVTATLLTTWLAMLILVVLAVTVGKNLKKVPGKLQNLFELIIGGAYDYTKSTLESESLAKKYFPILITIFLALLTMNWVGLLPGVTSIGLFSGHGEDSHFTPLLYPPATDLNIGLAFALIAMTTILVAGVSALGIFKYAGKFINFSSPIAFFVGLVELVSELSRIISFSFRLFGNIFAGKTLLTVAIFFAPFVVPVPILAYELFVGFIQAAVFSFLTLIFIKLAVAEPH